MSAPEHLDHLKVGGRVLRAGDVVKVTGLRGRWTIKYVVCPEGRPAEFTVCGGPRGHFRTVTADRIGTRTALAAKPASGKGR